MAELADSTAPTAGAVGRPRPRLLDDERPRPVREPDRWEDSAVEWIDSGRHRLWRAISDEISASALDPLLTARHPGMTLKTDLFDEAVSGGIVGTLREAGATTIGIDISRAICRRAATANPGLLTVVADARDLPFRDGAFETVVSFSTLDHFERREDIDLAVDEIGRVVHGGGQALVTLDNAWNPVVALRNALPPGVRRLLGVPYWVGPTLGPTGLRRRLERAGFVPSRTGALLHVPRVLAVLGAQFVSRAFAGRGGRSLARVCQWLERLDVLPTRYLTGYFTLVVGWRAPDVARLRRHSAA